MRHFDIHPLSEDFNHAIQDKIDNLNKPKGSLGRLESLALQICRIQNTLSPNLSHPCHLLLGGDHGIEQEGVSISPRAVTQQQMINFTRGGGGVNMFCRQHGFELVIVDMGVDADLTAYPILNCKIARGTNNFLHEPAMSEAQFCQAIETGAMLADRCRARGCNVLCIGEMGIANTSPSAVWMSIFGNIPLEECVGSGAGLDVNGTNRKCEILKRAVEKFNESMPNEILESESAKGESTINERTQSESTPNESSPTNRSRTEYVIRYFGGFEMVAAIGTMLRAAEHRMLILVDGFIMSACMLAASKLYPTVLQYAVFGHCGDESGHSRLLQLMRASPLLNLSMRLGEGTGALCAYPIIESAVRMINEMNNFKNANIDKYF